MQRRFALCLIALGLAQCERPAPTIAPSSGGESVPPLLVANPSDVDRERLLAGVRDAILADTSHLDAAEPARIANVWRWRLPDNSERTVWTICRGTGDTGACYLMLGHGEGHAVELDSRTNIGWSPPDASLAPDGALIITGQDGRGSFTTQATLSRSSALSERQYRP